MTNTIKTFDPDKSEISQNIKQLTPESSDEDIRAMFIEWNRKVLIPMIESILSELESAYAPYASMSVIPDMETANSKNYIRGAISTLEQYRVIYGEIIDSISTNMTKDQFLTMMGVIETRLEGGDWFPVSYGMGDAEIGSRYHNELNPAILFRYNEARRILKGFLDISYIEPLRMEYRKFKSELAVNNLENIGEDKIENAEILYTFFCESICPILWRISKIDDRQTDSWQLFEISPNDTEIPSLKRQMEYFSSWGEKANEYLSQLSETTQQNPEYISAKANLVTKIELLDSSLEKLRTQR